MNNDTQLVAEAFAAFKDDAASVPSLTLRGGNAVDSYADPPPYSSDEDAVDDDYLHRFRWGLGYLNVPSWRHYLPHLIAHAASNYVLGSDVTDALIQNLRPPDRGQLSSLSSEQEQVIVKLLDLIAFSETSPHTADARTALEEWWAPSALYRPQPI